MIGGCISWFRPGTVKAVNGNINAIKYQDILEDHLRPVDAQHLHQEGYIFQDDNALIHCARSTVTYKTQNHMQLLTCPAQSPDLNIIKNLWLFIKRKLQSR